MKNKQTCILVLGMHRSGTSALTGVLSLLDVYLGNELMKATSDNKKGYFENKGLFEINEELLSQIDSSWDDIFYNEIKLENIHNLDKLTRTIKKEFEHSDIFAIKDPRLAFLFPIYKKVLEELNIDIKIILPYRNPVEVASSLSKRDGMSMEKGMLLWAYHFLLAEKFTREDKRVFVGFDELMNDSQNTIKTISNKLEINLDAKYLENKKEIDDFLEPSLKHHNISIDNLSENTPRVVKEILKLKDHFSESKTKIKLDRLRYELFSYQKLFYNMDIINSLNEVQNKEQLIQERDQQIENKERLIQEKEEQLHGKAQLIEEQNHQLKDKDQLIQERDQQIENKERLIQEKEEVLDQRNQILKTSKEEIDSLKNELVLIYTGRSWKITRFLRKLKRYLK